MQKRKGKSTVVDCMNKHFDTLDCMNKHFDTLYQNRKIDKHINDKI